MPFVLGLAENSIQLVPDGTLIVHVIIILVMVYVLNATLYKPINQILESREKRTRGRLSEAQEVMKSVNEKITEHERSLRQARSEAFSLAESLRGEAMKDRQQKVVKSERSWQSRLRKRRKRSRQVAQARTSLEVESRQLARD